MVERKPATTPQSTKTKATKKPPTETGLAKTNPSRRTKAEPPKPAAPKSKQSVSSKKKPAPNPPTPERAMYQVHENGGRPFTVAIEARREAEVGPIVRVYRTRQIESKEWDGFDDCGLSVYKKTPPQPEELWVEWEHVTRVWVAQCPSLYATKKQSLGNSILLQITPGTTTTNWVKPPTTKRKKKTPAKAKSPASLYHYVHIGGIVFQFTTQEPIVEYESPIDNNDVPYQSALSATEAYFLCEQRRMPRSRIKPPHIDSESSSLKALPADALRWVLMYENLYDLEDEEAKRVTKPLENYEELIVPDMQS